MRNQLPEEFTNCPGTELLSFMSNLEIPVPKLNHPWTFSDWILTIIV
jgi:hypothetical protein